ncbi:MAG: hypothetical protein ACOYKZ_04155 [Chlamydiia bacterium]
MRAFFVALGALATGSSLLANIGPAGFHEFNYNRVFFETGTYGGSGIKAALQAGFPVVHSIDIEANSYRDAQRMFKGYPQVHLHRGDSGRDLWKVIRYIHEPITFWLDAHLGNEVPGRTSHTAVARELQQIARHPRKDHTILIDDMHTTGGPLMDYLTRADLERLVLQINPNYKIRYIPGGNDGEYPENILVATP